MATLKKEDSQLSDNANKPLIGARQAALTAVATTGATTSTPYGYTTAAQADAITARINEIITVLEAHGLVASND